MPSRVSTMRWCPRRRVQRSLLPQVDYATPVHAVLDAWTLREVLDIHLQPATNSTVCQDLSNLEAGLTPDGQESSELSDMAVLEAFLRVSLAVNPFDNLHPEATLAFQWVVDAFVKLRTRRARIESQGGMQRFVLPLRDQVCNTSIDEAHRIFADVVTSTYDTLSLRNPQEGGLSKIGSDALLRSLHLLHSRPLARTGQASQQQRAMLDAVLSITLLANWLAAGLTQRASMRSSRGPASRPASLASTTIAALGGVAFSGAARIQRMVSSEPANLARPLGANPLEPLIRCPLCRVATPSGRAIQHVHAGDSVPLCCVCTEAKADVCLPCGHFCLCGECFQHLPRTIAGSE